MTGNVIFCPFCGHKLFCPVPVPERAACPACGAVFELRYLIETALFPRAAQPAASAPEVPAQPPADRAASTGLTRPTPVRYAGLALIMAGVLGMVLSGVSALQLTYMVAGTIDPHHPPNTDELPPVTALLLTLLNTVGGMLIATGGIYTLVKPRSPWTWVGIAFTFLPTGCCCVLLAPFGLFALVNLMQLKDGTT